MANLNIFESFPLLAKAAIIQINLGSAQMQGVFIPGNITMNTVAVLLVGQTATTTCTQTLSFGLYTRNISTLTLVNSGSLSLTMETTGLTSFLTFVLSATSALVAGNYWLALQGTTAGQANKMLFAAYGAGQIPGQSVYGGLPVLGVVSTSSSALRASVNTSAVAKEGSSASALSSEPFYIIISS